MALRSRLEPSSRASEGGPCYHLFAPDTVMPDRKSPRVLLWSPTGFNYVQPFKKAELIMSLSQMLASDDSSHVLFVEMNTFRRTYPFVYGRIPNV